MPTTDVAQLIESIPGLADTGLTLARSIHRAVVEGGDAVRSVADVLHGTWLGHPLHPVLTDITVGSWTLASVFDGFARLTGTRAMDDQAEALTAIGIVSSLPTAITGVMDFAAVKMPAAGSASLHALTNSTGLVLYLCSLRARRRGHRSRAQALSLAGLLALLGGAWLGGHLVYRDQVGVNHTTAPDVGKDWAPVMDADELPEHRPACVRLNGDAVLLVRDGQVVHAMAATCSHAGGPLDEGQIVNGRYVQCPWHDSVFDVHTGQVVHGPATHPQPRVDARLHDGHVELRSA